MVNDINFSNVIGFMSASSYLVPESGGLYMLLGYQKLDGTYPVLYVGKSDNLRRRYGEHLNSDDKEIGTNVFSYVYSLESLALVRHTKELKLIDQYNPPINVQHKTLFSDVFKRLVPESPKLSDLLLRKPLGKFEQQLTLKKEIKPLGLGLLKKEPNKFPMSILKNNKPL